MAASGYTPGAFTANEVPTTAMWNLLWGNDASFYNGNGINDNAIITRHIASGIQLPDKTFNPCKFSVYRAAAWTDGNSGFVLVGFDTKEFDTGSNVDIVTNKGRFTAQIPGFYHLSAAASSNVNTSSFALMSLFKNGSEFKRGTQVLTASTNTHQRMVSTTVQLAANDYIEVYSYGTGGAGNIGSVLTYFSGFLLSGT